MVGKLLKAINNGLYDLKFSTSWSRWFYPPDWHSFKPYFTNAALNPIKYWLIFIPLISGLIAMFPIQLDYQNLQIIIGGDFDFPFSLRLSYIAAISYMFAFGIYLIRMPPFVRTNPSKFDRFPESVTKTEIAKEFRKTALACLPRVFTVASGETYAKRGSGELRRIEGGILDAKLVPPSLQEAQELVKYFIDSQTYTQKSLLRERHLPVNYGVVDEQFYKNDGLGGRPLIYDDSELDQETFRLLLFPNLRLRDRESDRDFVASKTYTSLFLCLSETRAVSRLFVSIFLFFSIVLGLIVLIQIMLEGIQIILGFQ